VWLGVDEIYPGKNEKFITVVSNLDSGEPSWFGRERKKEMLDQFFQEELSAGQPPRGRSERSVLVWSRNQAVIENKVFARWANTRFLHWNSIQTTRARTPA
jgi:hypothetical protein